jgi:plasmid maintenance system antidote protein VapI
MSTPKARSKRPPVPAHPGTEWLALIEARGTTQTAVAARMGVATVTLNRLINGHGIPTARITAAFARAMRQDVRELWQHVADYELALALARRR